LVRLKFEAGILHLKIKMQVDPAENLEVNMKLRIVAASLAAFLLLLVSSSRARGADKGDAYFGYTRVGANMFGPNDPGMNGWQAALHVKMIPFFGIEGDVSHYGQHPSGLSESTTLAMFGPRVTAHAAGFSVFAHALGGLVHDSADIPLQPSVSYTAASYALGGGADVPLFLGFKLRGTVDYLGNSNEPSSGSRAPQHYRAGVGLAYHF
jgi:hypothetical protein